MKKVLRYIFLYPIAYAYYRPKKALRFVGFFAVAVLLVWGVSSIALNHANEAPEVVPTFTQTKTPDPTPGVVSKNESDVDTVVPDTSAAPPSVFLPVFKDYDTPEFLCDNSFVYDITEDKYLYVNGHDEQILPASTTKLLTILYARTFLPLDLEVKPGDELKMLGPNSSIAQLAVHHTLTVEQLIEGMLLPSGNDAAHVLAAAGGRAIDPSVKSGQEAVLVFMKGMNEYAKEIGMTGSNFITPDGYDREGHYSTVEDMIIVAKLAYNDPIIRKYSAVVSDRVMFASGHLITWKNTNNCINPGSKYYNSYINGLKTGTANDNYYCFIGSANIGGREFVFGFFGEEKLANRFIDANRAVEWLKEWVVD